jgi:hypothetical protein
MPNNPYEQKAVMVANDFLNAYLDADDDSFLTVKNLAAAIASALSEAVEAEREACAKIADHESFTVTRGTKAWKIAVSIREIIRSRRLAQV